MENDELKVRFKNIDEDIKRFDKRSHDIVGWRVFIWIMGIFLSIFITIMGWRIAVINELQAKIEKNSSQFMTIQVQLSKIKVQQAEIITEIKWLKN